MAVIVKTIAAILVRPVLIAGDSNHII